MIKRILVALSGTPYTAAAVAHSLELARTHEATLTGVTLIDPVQLADVGPVPIGGGAAAHALAEHRLRITEERVEEQIAAFELACRENGLTACVVRETGDAMTELVNLWRYHDMTIFGLRGLFHYDVVDSPDDEIIKIIAKGVRPILAVAEEYRPIKRVLIAYNGSMESAKAMKRFVQMRLWPKVEAKIVCFDCEQAEAEDLLSCAAEYCRSHGLDPQTENIPEHPSKGLLEHAHKWDADLIVMGSSARSKIMRFVLGDTAVAAIKHSDLPLYLAQ